MPVRDLHEKPFDEGTITKLAIYRSYVRAWLQVFLHAVHYNGKPLQFYDFFCGPGQDCAGKPGSPIILLEELFRERSLIEQQHHEVSVVFDDRDNEKINALKQLCVERNFPWQPRFESLEFRDVFASVRHQFARGPTLVFIDQNGMKHMTRAVFEALVQADTTDFLFFTASSFKLRFGDLLAPEIRIPDNISYLEAHRALADQYREWAPSNVFIGHFAIKKGSNIYGLVFGSHHWRGLQKFLEIAWKLDANCGEANYELEHDTVQGLMDFEKGTTGFKKRKSEVFQAKLAELILAGTLKSDDAVFRYCLVNGFLPRVVKDVYVSLRDTGVLKNAKANFPRYSAEAMKSPRKLEI
jgi:three-Cys-motif partner protein